MALAGPRVAAHGAAVPATGGAPNAPSLVSRPMIHAGPAAPDLWVALRVTALTYLPGVRPISSRSPALAPWAGALTSASRPRVKADGWRWATRRGGN
eukprot:8489943-Alexandrium_andersonii.AAC.1